MSLLGLKSALILRLQMHMPDALWRQYRKSHDRLHVDFMISVQCFPAKRLALHYGGSSAVVRTRHWRERAPKLLLRQPAWVRLYTAPDRTHTLPPAEISARHDRDVPNSSGSLVRFALGDRSHDVPVQNVPCDPLVEFAGATGNNKQLHQLNDDWPSLPGQPDARTLTRLPIRCLSKPQVSTL
jgi:hypothetical protein